MELALALEVVLGLVVPLLAVMLALVFVCLEVEAELEDDGGRGDSGVVAMLRALLIIIGPPLPCRLIRRRLRLRLLLGLRLKIASEEELESHPDLAERPSPKEVKVVLVSARERVSSSSC